MYVNRIKRIFQNNKILYINHKKTNQKINNNKWYLENYYLIFRNKNIYEKKYLFMPQNFNIPYKDRYESIDFKPKN